MDAVVDGMIRLDPPALPPRAMELLWRGLTFPNPEYVNRVRFGRWVGATPEEITLVERGARGEIRIPRGAVGLLQDAVRAAQGSLVFRDHRTTCEPIGYVGDRERRRLVVVPDEAEQVRTMFQLYLRLGSAAEVAHRVGELGWERKTTRTHAGREVGGGAWTEKDVQLLPRGCRLEAGGWRSSTRSAAFGLQPAVSSLQPDPVAGATPSTCFRACSTAACAGRR